MFALSRAPRGWLLAITIGPACVASDDSRITAPDPVRHIIDIELWPRAATLPFVDDTVRIAAQAIDSLGYAVEGKAFTWTSSDTAVAKVSVAGVVTAIGPGSVAITASTDGVSASATIAIDPGLVVTNTCASCHWERKENGHFVWSLPESTCFSCHPRSVTLEHWTSSLGHEAASAGFVLEGRHELYPCEVCHTLLTGEMKFGPASVSDCVACHRSDYDAQHGGSGLPTTCAACHAPTGWRDVGTGPGHGSGGLQLVGVHADLNCSACHDADTFDPRFTPTDANDCVACHQPDYDGQHGGSGVPTRCVACHTPTRWPDVVSGPGHGVDDFQLVGVHADLNCFECHDVDTFDPLYTPADANDCVACHQSDYDREHSSSGYPVNCASCHTPTLWKDATFDHDADYFPVYSEKHRGKWQTCATCHPSNTDFSSFTCFNCHKHNRADMDDKHDNEAGYSYVSSACLSCHPDGRD